MACFSSTLALISFQKIDRIASIFIYTFIFTQLFTPSCETRCSTQKHAATCGTSVNISHGACRLTRSSHGPCSSDGVSISSSFVKGIYPGYRNLDWGNLLFRLSKEVTPLSCGFHSFWLKVCHTLIYVPNYVVSLLFSTAFRTSFYLWFPAVWQQRM